MSKRTLSFLGPTSLFLAVALLGTGCDLQTKSWAESGLGTLPGRSVGVFDPWLDLSLTYNRGTAFSIFGDLGDTLLFFGVLSFVVALGMLLYVWIGKVGRFEALALGTIAAGALGNGYDRIFRHAPGGGTGVVDFIKFNYPWGGSWPTFNVADVLVVVGVALLVIATLMHSRASTERASTTG